MFDGNSRYVNCPLLEVEMANGKRTNAVMLRRLPFVPGLLTEVKGTDRLDIMAFRKYRDGTMFWHIADANSELEANRLVERESPENPLTIEVIPYIPVPES